MNSAFDAVLAIRVCRVSLVVCVVIGALLMLAAILLVPALPYFQLDRVLTSQELSDPQAREATLALLKKASGNTWLVWLAVGLSVTISASIGLIATFPRHA